MTPEVRVGGRVVEPCYVLRPELATLETKDDDFSVTVLGSGYDGVTVVGLADEIGCIDGLGDGICYHVTSPPVVFPCTV